MDLIFRKLEVRVSLRNYLLFLIGTSRQKYSATDRGCPATQEQEPASL